MKHISKQETLVLQDKFPLVLREDLDDAEDLGTFSAVKTLSIFDHWLSEEEASNEIMAYISINEENKNTYIERENRLLRFFEQLLRSISSYFFIEDEEGDSGKYYSFSSDEGLVDMVIKGIREEVRFNILLPEIGVMICTGYDMTFDLYFLNSEHYDAIFELAKSNDLFLL